MDNVNRLHKELKTFGLVCRAVSDSDVHFSCQSQTKLEISVAYGFAVCIHACVSVGAVVGSWLTVETMHNMRAHSCGSSELHSGSGPWTDHDGQDVCGTVRIIQVTPLKCEFVFFCLSFIVCLSTRVGFSSSPCAIERSVSLQHHLCMSEWKTQQLPSFVPLVSVDKWSLKHFMTNSPLFFFHPKLAFWPNMFIWGALWMCCPFTPRSVAQCTAAGA